jgi:hypothetical protein
MASIRFISPRLNVKFWCTGDADNIQYDLISHPVGKASWKKGADENHKLTSFRLRNCQKLCGLDLSICGVLMFILYVLF